MNRLADLERVRGFSRHGDAGGALQRICDYLKREIDHYDWVGFYLAAPAERVLLLGPFSGAPTEHLKIAYGEGICGQVADATEALVVPDVSAETNYLSCSIATRAEIVIPVWHKDEFVGELDIDSHTTDPFTSDDEELLSEVAEICAPLVSSILAENRPG